MSCSAAFGFPHPIGFPSHPPPPVQARDHGWAQAYPDPGVPVVG